MLIEAKDLLEAMRSLNKVHASTHYEGRVTIKHHAKSGSCSLSACGSRGSVATHVSSSGDVDLQASVPAKWLYRIARNTSGAVELTETDKGIKAESNGLTACCEPGEPEHSLMPSTEGVSIRVETSKLRSAIKSCKHAVGKDARLSGISIHCGLKGAYVFATDGIRACVQTVSEDASPGFLVSVDKQALSSFVDSLKTPEANICVNGEHLIIYDDASFQACTKINPQSPPNITRLIETTGGQKGIGVSSVEAKRCCLAVPGDEVSVYCSDGKCHISGQKGEEVTAGAIDATDGEDLAFKLDRSHLWQALAALKGRTAFISKDPDGPVLIESREVKCLIMPTQE